jgi:hypothetical protein
MLFALLKTDIKANEQYIIRQSGHTIDGPSMVGAGCLRSRELLGEMCDILAQMCYKTRLRKGR